MALADPDRMLTLVESKRKKSIFLEMVKEQLELDNINIQCISIEDFFSKNSPESEEQKTLISRGFPRFDIFCHWIEQGKIAEAVIITSNNKIKKNQKGLAIVAKKIYNIPWREELKIIKMVKKDIIIMEK